MSVPAEMGLDELRTLKTDLEKEHRAFVEKGLSLNMARGKPGADQLDLSLPILHDIKISSVYRAAAGDDCRNYGVLDGLPEAKALMAVLLDDTPENIIVYGNSSLNIMYDTVARCFAFGVCGSAPWSSYDRVKWLCPVPGYDRHFSITEFFGVEMIPVPLNEDGPDMDIVEKLVADDTAVKGIWCVPKYSNPGGTSYSAKVVRRLASMKCAAEDFRIFRDNAYSVHHLYESPVDHDKLLDIGLACRNMGNPDRAFKFASTSKITFPGAGIAAFASSPANLADAKRVMEMQTIGHDKINQLRHVLFFRDAEGIAAHMRKHAAILRPKFELVLRKLEEGLKGSDCGSWTTPRGGYFISFDAPKGTAKRTVELAKQAGVELTGAGATYPYKNDPLDSNIRIAPTFPPLAELEAAMDVFVCCVKLATVESLL